MKKKLFLALAVLFAVGEMQAQEVMNLKLADGKTLEIPVEDISKVYFDTTASIGSKTFREMLLLKQHILLHVTMHWVKILKHPILQILISRSNVCLR